VRAASKACHRRRRPRRGAEQGRVVLGDLVQERHGVGLLATSRRRVCSRACRVEPHGEEDRIEVALDAFFFDVVYHVIQFDFDTWRRCDQSPRPELNGAAGRPVCRSASCHQL